MLDVPEGYFIVLMPDGKFAKMDAQTFMANFEEKDTNTAGLTFDEKRLFEKMNKLFGKDLKRRFGKLSEEYDELFEAIERGSQRREITKSECCEIRVVPDRMSEVIDELADMNAVLFHIAALLGYSQKELLEMAATKIEGRQIDPNFMRKHPHKKNDIYCSSKHDANDVYCGNCAAFKCEDMNGDGYCETCDTMRYCGDLACHEWQSKAENQQYKHFEERFNNKQ